MKKSPWVLMVVMLLSAGCMTHYAEFSGPRVIRDNGVRPREVIYPYRSTVFHAGSDTHGRVEIIDSGYDNYRHRSHLYHDNADEHRR